METASVRSIMKKKLIFGSGLSSYKDEEGLYQVCSAAIDNGITAFDTAPSYRTEEVLGQVLNDIIKERNIPRNELWIQTKIDPIQMYEGNVVEYFKGKLQSMHLEHVDALLIHWPVYKYFRKTWEALLSAKELGLTRRIGICNLRLSHLEELKSIGIIPEILQIERHPLNTFTQEAIFCKENSIALQDYSPLCKMHPLLKENAMLQDMAVKYGITVGLLILRWHLDTGATPIFTSKKSSRIAEYAAIDHLHLNEDDCSMITSLNKNHKLYLESLICPGF